jgi:hypothetical protein
MKQGNLRNCTKLRNSLLGNGELASLAYGSFKELLQIKDLFQGAELIRGMFEAIWGMFEAIWGMFEAIWGQCLSAGFEEHWTRF